MKAPSKIAFSDIHLNHKKGEYESTCEYWIGPFYTKMKFSKAETLSLVYLNSEINRQLKLATKRVERFAKKELKKIWGIK